MASWFYILRLQSGALYCGATQDLKKRWDGHQAGRASRTTGMDLPQAVVYSEELPDFATARRREAQVKRWTRAKKEALVAGDKPMLKSLSKRRGE